VQLNAGGSFRGAAAISLQEGGTMDYLRLRRREFDTTLNVLRAYPEDRAAMQFSVYLQLAGAKVPSIYGPTADYAWSGIS
jgi:hypothetical protein